ncbi:MAG: FAD-dependent oxidoreductase [Myxococcota bacterium]|jgi:oxygen-dependent protoporphyrinogen oxidase|nr:FAD-dependent oxidoreductase [Myxococcota bacterium]
MASVLVIGAGLAGLACAWRLQRAGFDVEVLEREAAPGGRARSREHEGFLIEPGVGVFASRDNGLHGLARHVDLASDVQSILRFPDAIDTAHGMAAVRPIEDPLFVQTDAVHRSDAWRLGRLRVEALRWRRELDPVSEKAIGALDSLSAVTWLDRVVGRGLRRERVVPYASALAGMNVEALSAAAFLRFAERLRGVRPQYLIGGLALLANRLADRLNVRFGCDVSAIESEDDGARVRYRAGAREGRAMADAVVVAVTGPSMASLCPKLVPSERGFFESLSFARRTVAHLLFDAAPAVPHRMIAFPPRDGFGVSALEVAHHMRGAAPSGAGLLRAVLSEAATGRLSGATDAEVAGVVLDNLERSAVGRLTPREVIVDRIDAAAPIAGPGFFASLARFENRVERTPRMAFAGDYFAGQGAEAAISSGLHAASEIAHALPPRSVSRVV